MQNKNLRIFIGPIEVANVGATLADALREKGIRVTVVTTEILPFNTGMKYDVVLDLKGFSTFRRRLIYLYYVLKFLWQHNIFIFLFGSSFFPYNLDLPILKLLGKKTIMWFMGSDIRHYESVEAAAKKVGLKKYTSKDQGAGPKALKRKLRMIHMVEKYVDHIITGPSIDQLLNREYIGKEMTDRIYLPIDVSNIRYSNIPNPKPVVVHAPTAEKYKGTSYILEAVEQLKREGYEFEFRLFRNTSNTKVRENLSEADITVDQLFAAGPGMLALESMAAGCAVLSGNVPEFSGFPHELPIIHTDPDNIYYNLKLLLENPELRQELGEQGRKYVEKYHDHRKIGGDIIRLLTGNKSNRKLGQE